MKVEVLDSNLSVENVARIARLSRGIDPLDYKNDSKIPYERTVINCCNKHHMSVFEFADITYVITCPIYVARQLMRYRTASYLERSLRYNLPIEENEEYAKLIAAGVPKEKARAVLPLSTETKFVMKVNLRSLIHILEERLAPSAQMETQEVAREMWQRLFEKSNVFAYLIANKIGHPSLYLTKEENENEKDNQ